MWRRGAPCICVGRNYIDIIIILSIIFTKTEINMQQVYNIDIQQARVAYDCSPDGRYDHWCLLRDGDKPKHVGNFSAYSPAYVSSNEQVADIIKWLNPAGKTALAIAGSGDMPIFLSAYGAAHVDTFDVSYNARVIMDVKTHMLMQGVHYWDYISTLRDLKSAPDILNCKSTETLFNAVTSQTAQYLRAMHGCKIFLHSECGEIAYLPTQAEYAAMRQNVRTWYDFIWTDLFSLSGQISGQKYDIIYLSNVLQYVMVEKDILDVLNGLRDNLNPGGIIVVDALLSMYSSVRRKRYESVSEKISWAEMIYHQPARTMFLKAR